MLAHRVPLLRFDVLCEGFLAVPLVVCVQYVVFGDSWRGGSVAAKGVLLANHGPVIGGADLDTAVYAAEELKETAKLHVILRSLPTSFLTTDQ